MNYRSLNDLNSTILKQLHLIPRDIDLIVGVPRSGMLPANLLALYLNLPYTDIHSFMNGYIYQSGARRQFITEKEYKKILVVDDSIASGSALKECKRDLADFETRFDIQYCVIYYTPEKGRLADYAFEAVATPRYFQWNIFNHTSLEKACFDIDGVLCVDPSDEQNDDGPLYRDFLLNAVPLYIPKCKIGTIVTSRLEKYRSETEAWLQKNGIRYDKLVMLDLPDMKARQKANNHAQHKAKEFESKPYTLFIESNLSQAVEINKITKKPVFCTENFEMVYNSESLVYNIKSGKYFPFLRRLALKMRSLLIKQKNIRVTKRMATFSKTYNL
ncbi:phosphoribosyltransferase family protein [Flavobacterium sp. NRK F7]|uniref:phosphoribosyltransferase family protein n=1 Tax=Flavobacterium sp. NRK F7 TaxID=2954930 RepID=UPI002090AF22|nr:phosphoribosyltransferase family protein [Flavobacterium sp. NRK F7]MCO6161427.1 phosphoribosyl transferase [Flavobacterium sp. NRK F7]